MDTEIKKEKPATVNNLLEKIKKKPWPSRLKKKEPKPDITKLAFMCGYLEKTADWRSRLASLSPEAISKLEQAGLIPSIEKYTRGLRKGSLNLMKKHEIKEAGPDLQKFLKKSLIKLPAPIRNFAEKLPHKVGGLSISTGLGSQIQTYLPVGKAVQANPFYKGLTPSQARLMREIIRRHEITESVLGTAKANLASANASPLDPKGFLDIYSRMRQQQKILNQGKIFSHHGSPVYATEAKVTSRLPFKEIPQRVAEIRSKKPSLLTRFLGGKKLMPTKTENGLIQQITGNPNIYTNISKSDINKLNKWRNV